MRKPSPAHNAQPYCQRPARVRANRPLRPGGEGQKTMTKTCKLRPHHLCREVHASLTLRLPTSPRLLRPGGERWKRCSGCVDAPARSVKAGEERALKSLSHHVSPRDPSKLARGVHMALRHHTSSRPPRSCVQGQRPTSAVLSKQGETRSHDLAPPRLTPPAPSKGGGSNVQRLPCRPFSPRPLHPCREGHARMTLRRSTSPRPLHRNGEGQRSPPVELSGFTTPALSMQERACSHGIAPSHLVPPTPSG